LSLISILIISLLPDKTLWYYCIIEDGIFT